MLLPINTPIANRYVVSKLLGQGGMADIYEGYDRYLKKDVAIKTVKEFLLDNKEETDRFENEARYISSFSHPNIIKLYNVVSFNHHSFIVYELMKGKTLKNVLDERKLSLEEIFKIILEVLSGTKHIHERGVLHNDLKPDNIFIFYDGRVKILDFGIATHIGENNTHALASLQYVAPEVIKSHQYSVQSDIYSLGLLLFELLTNRPAFISGNKKEEIDAHLKGEIPSVSGYLLVKETKLFDQVIKKATNLKVKKRYQNDQEMIDDLLKIKESHKK